MALLFDQLAITGYSGMENITKFRYPSDMQADLDWLSSENILWRGEIPFDPDRINDPDLRGLKPISGKTDDLFNKEYGNVQFVIQAEKFPDFVKDKRDKRAIEYLEGLIDASTRYFSQYLRDYLKLAAFPILKRPIDSIDSRAQKNDILELVINKLPVPSADTPWEKIIDFRNDPETQNKLLALKNWISEIPRSNFSIPEVEERLDHLTQEYRSYMELQRIKSNTGTLETIFVTTAEVVENLLRLSPSKATKSLFAIRNRKIALLESEKSAPGREVAFIIKALEQFA